MTGPFNPSDGFMGAGGHDNPAKATFREAAISRCFVAGHKGLTLSACGPLSLATTE